jgi:hypothetical protein
MGLASPTSQNRPGRGTHGPEHADDAEPVTLLYRPTGHSAHASAPDAAL